MVIGEQCAELLERDADAAADAEKGERRDVYRTGKTLRDTIDQVGFENGADVSSSRARSPRR
jgi:hypothetical protein